MTIRICASPRALAVPALASVLACVSPAAAGVLFHRRARPKPQPAPASCPSCSYQQAPAPAELPAPAPAAAEAEVRQVLDAQAAAWNRGDLDAFMAGYWQSPDLTFFSGADRTAGWQATLERYRKRYQADGKEMGRLAFSDVSVEMLGPDAALVRGHWALRLSKDAPSGLFTLVFRRTPDGWRIIHDHTSK